MYDIILIKCVKCGKETSSQTKILGIDEAHSFKIGDEIYNEEFANCVLKLKGACKCGSDNAIIIKNKKIIGVTNSRYATCIEKLWGDYEFVDELREIVAEKLKKIGKMTREFVVFKGKKFYSPYKCLCCGKEVTVKQFCYGRTCAYCDCGRCCNKGGYEKGHGRKDIFEEAEEMGDEFQELVKEKLEKIKDGN